MANGAAECYNGHRFCALCAINRAAKDLGIPALKWKSSIFEGLSWSGFWCCICGVRGPLRRSAVTDAAVASLAVRCRFTTMGVVCRWSGRRDQFDTHQHVFADPDEKLADTQNHPPRRGRKRPVSDANAVFHEDDGLHTKQRREQRISNDNEKEDDVQFQSSQTADPDIVPQSGTIPDYGSPVVIHDDDQEAEEGREFQLVRTSTASDVREKAVPVDDDRAAAIPPGEFHEVYRALINAGLIPEPVIPLLDRVAIIIFNVAVRVLRRVSATLRPSHAP